MKIKSQVSYFDRVRRGKSPASYHANQPNGVGKTVYAKIKLDPILKDKPKVRRLVILHEKNELKAWGLGESKKGAHKIAKRATKRDDKFDTSREFWRLIQEGR